MILIAFQKYNDRSSLKLKTISISQFIISKLPNPVIYYSKTTLKTYTNYSSDPFVKFLRQVYHSEQSYSQRVLSELSPHFFKGFWHDVAPKTCRVLNSFLKSTISVTSNFELLLYIVHTHAYVTVHCSTFNSSDVCVCPSISISLNLTCKVRERGS